MSWYSNWFGGTNVSFNKDKTVATAKDQRGNKADFSKDGVKFSTPDGKQVNWTPDNGGTFKSGDYSVKVGQNGDMSATYEKKVGGAKTTYKFSDSEHWEAGFTLGPLSGKANQDGGYSVTAGYQYKGATASFTTVYDKNGRVKSSTTEFKVGDYGVRVKSYTDSRTGHEMVEQTTITPYRTHTETHDLRTYDGVNESWAGDFLNTFFDDIGNKVVDHHRRNERAGDDDFGTYYNNGRNGMRRDPLVIDLDRDGLETVGVGRDKATSFL